MPEKNTSLLTLRLPKWRYISKLSRAVTAPCVVRCYSTALCRRGRS